VRKGHQAHRFLRENTGGGLCNGLYRRAWNQQHEKCGNFPEIHLKWAPLNGSAFWFIVTQRVHKTEKRTSVRTADHRVPVSQRKLYLLWTAQAWVVCNADDMRLHSFLARTNLRQPMKVFQMYPCLSI
jgi:hypothetical protein